MYIKMIIVAAVLLFATSVASPQKITVDIDKTADFMSVRSFGWDKGQIAPKATTSRSIVDAIERELISRGLVKNDDAPDIRIAVMAAADMDLQGVGPSWNNEIYRSWGGYGNPSALMTLTKGTLLIDLIATKNKHSIWRGVVKGVLVDQPTGNAAKDAADMDKLVKKTIGKMFKKYPVKRVK